MIVLDPAMTGSRKRNLSFHGSDLLERGKRPADIEPAVAVLFRETSLASDLIRASSGWPRESSDAWHWGRASRRAAVAVTNGVAIEVPGQAS